MLRSYDFHSVGFVGLCHTDESKYEPTCDLFLSPAYLSREYIQSCVPNNLLRICWHIITLLNESKLQNSITQ